MIRATSQKNLTAESHRRNGHKRIWQVMCGFESVLFKKIPVPSHHILDVFILVHRAGSSMDKKLLLVHILCLFGLSPRMPFLDRRVSNLLIERFRGTASLVRRSILVVFLESLSDTVRWSLRTVRLPQRLETRMVYFLQKATSILSFSARVRFAKAFSLRRDVLPQKLVFFECNNRNGVYILSDPQSPNLSRSSSTSSYVSVDGVIKQKPYSAISACSQTSGWHQGLQYGSLF